MKKWFKRLTDDNIDLEEKIFGVILVIGTIIVIFSTIVTFFEDLSLFATIGTLIALLIFIMISVVKHKLRKDKLARILLCYTINCIVMPITFFSCGGIDSGMPLYLLAGLFIIIPSLDGIARVVCLLISLISDVAMVGLSYNMMNGNKAKTQFPKEILAKLTLEDRVVDMVASLTLVALFLCVTTLLILNAYKREREKSKILYEKVNELSRRDELTGLYNRRVLFRKFDNIEFDEGSKYHVAMLDIDFFKKINDKYGHLFGDDVLRKIAKEMREFCNEGEYAARYGGEEFVLVFKAVSEENAYNRIEDFRKKIESIKWEEDAELSITLSGGLVACKDYDEITPVLSTADKMLYTAKKSGRNRICCDAA